MYSGEETGGLWTGGYTSIRVAPRTPYTFQHFYFPVFMYDKGQGHAVHRRPHNYPVIKRILTLIFLPTSTFVLNLFLSLFTDEDQDESVTCSLIQSLTQSLLPLQGTIDLWRWLWGMWLLFWGWALKKQGMLGKHIRSPSLRLPLPRSRPNRRVHRRLHGHYDSVGVCQTAPQPHQTGSST